MAPLESWSYGRKSAGLLFLECFTFILNYFFIVCVLFESFSRRVQWKRKVGNVLILDSIIRYEAIWGRFRGCCCCWARSRDIWQTHRAMKRISTQKTPSLISLLAIAASRGCCWRGWRESSRCPNTTSRRALKVIKVGLKVPKLG